MAILQGIFYVFFLVFAGTWAAMPGSVRYLGLYLDRRRTQKKNIKQIEQKQNEDLGAHGWKACKLGSPEYNDCMIKQVNTAVQTLKGGSKTLKVNPLDPLKILKLHIGQGSGPVSIKLDFKNTELLGLSSCVLKTVKNTDWKKLEGTALCKNVILNGDYKIDGKVLTLPIQGEGKSKIVMDDMSVDAMMELKEIEKGGKKHLQANNFRVKLTPAKASFNLENLFNGNKALGDNMNTFLTENGNLIFKELQPAIAEAMSQAFTQVSNQVFVGIPANEIKI